ncbi:MAG TPA: glycoside hydrolase family 43 protein, partial [Acidimicrobiales bacterium]|nr:glycoside hydrolase family 43 protein [Acidimicrobiales bacterium]
AAGQSVARTGQALTDLQDCLLGVDGAYGALTGGDNLPGAVAALDDSSGDCLAADGGAASGLAYPFDFPDPFVLTVGDTYYAYGTNAAAGNIQIVTSTDLAHWSPVGDALPQLPSWAAPGGGTWAPSVLQLGGTFVLYFSAIYGTANEQCIGAAVSSSPTGPFVDASNFPIVCQLAQGGSIDPSPFVDPAGGLFLDWKSQGANGQAPTIWAQPMAGTGTQLTGNSPTAILGPSQSWEHGWTEAPDMFWLDGQRYLFYAGSDWKTASYGVGVGECRGPLGPCHKPLDHPIFSSQAIIAGPGGASAFTDVDGQPWIAFAAWLTGEVGFPHSRVLFLRPLEVVDGVPAVCPAPATAAAPPTGQCP